MHSLPQGYAITVLLAPDSEDLLETIRLKSGQRSRNALESAGLAGDSVQREDACKLETGSSKANENDHTGGSVGGSEPPEAVSESCSGSKTLHLAAENAKC